MGLVFHAVYLVLELLLPKLSFIVAFLKWSVNRRCSSRSVAGLRDTFARVLRGRLQVLTIPLLDVDFSF